MNINDIRNLGKDIADGIREETSCDDKREDLLWESVDGNEHVIYYGKAWNTVNAARDDSQLFDQAHDSLSETEGDKVGKNETLDNVICRLAFWIIYHSAQDALAN